MAMTPHLLCVVLDVMMQMRLFARDVVGSAMWGTVRGLADSVKELAPNWTHLGGHNAMPPAVILSVCMSMCLHMSGMIQ
eukprot:5645258-Pyramimonas_sp.AAC.5